MNQIVILGKENLSVYHGLKEYGADSVHFILTELTANMHLAILEMLPRNLKWATYIVEPYDAHYVEKVCREIHNEYPGDYIYNLSEGTKVMTIAALNVAKEHNAKALFISQTGDVVNLVDFSVDTLKSTLSNEEILKVAGSRLWTYVNVKELSYADIQSSNMIKRFIERNNNDYSRIQKFFRYECHRKIEQLPDRFRINEDLEVNTIRGSIRIYKNKKPVLILNHPKSAFLMFGGRWWEAAVASQVKRWAEDRDHNIEAWQSVVFQSVSDESKVKNEVDILINFNNHKLIFLECKSGFISQDDVYKMNSVRDTYGGEDSIAGLASYYPLDPLIREKCDDLGIKVFAPSCERDVAQNIYTLHQWLDSIYPQEL